MYPKAATADLDLVLVLAPFLILRSGLNFVPGVCVEGTGSSIGSGPGPGPGLSFLPHQADSSERS